MPCQCNGNAFAFCHFGLLWLQWRHQDLKSGGARRGQRLIMGGQTCARTREPIFGGVQGPALGPLAGCRGRAPAGGPGGGAPGRLWIYAFQSMVTLLHIEYVFLDRMLFDCAQYARYALHCAQCAFKLHCFEPPMRSCEKH